jgi:tetratricopeptide (TPR) repeat protein
VRIWFAGGLDQDHRIPHAVTGDRKGGGRPGGGGQGVRKPRQRVWFARGLSNTIKYQTQHLVIAKEVVDRAGEGMAYGNLGNVYHSQRAYAKAIEYHMQHLSIAKEVVDRAGKGTAYGNLGIAHGSMGDFSEAFEYQTQRLAIVKEVGDHPGEGSASGILGTGHMRLNKYDKVVAYFEEQHALALSLKHAHVQSNAALNMGVALILHVRATRQSATGADPVEVPLAPAPHSHSSASACLNDRVHEAAKWLQDAFDSGHKFGKLHLSHLTSMRARGRGADTSQRAPFLVCATGT